MNKLFVTVCFSFFLFASCTSRQGKIDENAEEVVEESKENVTSRPKSKYDTRKELENFFTHQKSGALEQVMAKHINKEGDGIYCSFFMKSNRAISLKLHIQYMNSGADLFELDADGVMESYEVNKTHTSAENIQIVEGVTFKWYDKNINLADEEFIRKIGSAENVTLTLKVKKTEQVLSIVKLTKEERLSLVRTIDYYKSMENSAQIPKKGMVNIRG